MLTGAILLVALGVGMAWLPVPYVVEMPGPTVNTLGSRDGRQIISVSGRPVSKSSGHLNMTTVTALDEIDLGTAIRYWFDPESAVVPREFVYPPGRSREQLTDESADEFKNSQTSAETAALRKLGYPVMVTVEKVDAGAPAEKVLAAGDVLVAVDGTKITSNTHLQSVIAARKPGQKVTLKYRRGETDRTGTVTLGKSERTPGAGQLGANFQQKQPHPFKVEIQLDNIGGPSAGLMFALGIVDLVRPADLTDGRFIAGTGTIDDDGKVGAIGGIPQKLIAARKAGATVFLVPAGNCEEAKISPPAGLQLIRVGTLDDGLTALDKLRTGGTPKTC